MAERAAAGGPVGGRDGPARGQLAVGPGANEPAAERAKQFQRMREAAGVQLSAGAGPPVAGKVVLEYRYEWNGAQLEAVNQALRHVQAAPGTVIREQTEGFQQPPSQWPVRAGEEGWTTLIIPPSDSDQQDAAARAERITFLLQEKGAWLRAIRPQQNGTVELNLGYRTQHPDFLALSGMLDKWHATTNVEVQETAYARLVRAEVRQAATVALPAPDKAITLPVQAQEQKTGEYERD